MDNKRLEILLESFFNNTIDPEDCKELLNLMDSSDQVLLSELIDRLVRDREDGPDFNGLQSTRVYTKIVQAPDFTDNARRKTYTRGWLKVAAIIVVSLSLTLLYFINRKNGVSSGTDVTKYVNTIVPGGKKAVLTLSNGKRILLESANPGELATEKGVKITKAKRGEIIYDASNSARRSQESAMNKIETPKGGEYQIVLPDGTKVWLNASSSLSFPAVFTGNKRNVRLDGEAYFEVAASRSRPFEVLVNGASVCVLGTQFNITSYTDDNTFTTALVEGSVKVLKNDKEVLLKPGDQAIVDRTSSKINVSAANISDIIAWKNGYFVFHDEDIRSIMQKISRWYDIEVEYRGNVPEQKFGGAFNRSKSFVQLLHYLEKLGSVHFKIEGRRVIVMR